ncbi:hypothetical protein BCR44DRAFT_1436784, partial [Catenaria anguillulae PL171]
MTAAAATTESPTLAAAPSTAPTATGPQAPPTSFDRIYTDEDDPNLLHRKLLAAVYAEHEKIRFAEVVMSLQKATLPLVHYVLYLATLAQIYIALESALDSAAQAATATGDSHNVMPRIHFPRELNRLPAVLSDLAFFVGKENVDKWVALAETKATREWADRLKSLATGANHGSHCLIAHSYTRYLGDLAGGQILRHRVAKMYQLPSDGEGGFKGIAFYEFRAIPDVKYFKAMYRQTLNQIGDELGEGCRDEICKEAIFSFELNYRILEELAEVVKTLTEFPGHLTAHGVPDEVKLAGYPDAPSPTPVAEPPSPTTAKAIADAMPVGHPMVSGAAGGKCPMRTAVPIVGDPSVSTSIMALGLGFLGFAIGK